MSRYDALTEKLRAFGDEPRVTLTFEQLDEIVGLPDSAKSYFAWWANSRSSQAHSKAWLDAGRRASPDFRARHTVFTLDPSVLRDSLVEAEDSAVEQSLVELAESTLSLERDLEDHLCNNLDALEQGLAFVSRQVVLDVGRVDILARAADGQTVVIELKAGEARDGAIGQIARYIGWYTAVEGRSPRALLVAGSFSEPVKFAAKAIPGLQLMTYRVSFSFSEAKTPSALATMELAG